MPFHELDIKSFICKKELKKDKDYHKALEKKLKDYV